MISAPVDSVDSKRTWTVPFGVELVGALAQAISCAKAGSPLRPVTVIVPRFVVGLRMRRSLAAAGIGVANTSFVTTTELSFAITGHRPSDRVSTEQVQSSARAAAAVPQSRFSSLIAHPSTQMALAGTHRTLHEIGRKNRELLRARGSERTVELIDTIERMDACLGRRITDAEVVWSAVERLASDPPDQHDRFIIVQTEWPGPADAALIKTLRKTRDAALVDGVGAVSATERSAFSFIAERIAGPTEIVEAHDPAAEVTAVLRRVARLIDEGMAADRIAIVYPGPGPYLRIITEQLTRLGVAWFAPSTNTIASTLVGRVLERFISLIASDGPAFERDAVVDLLASGPLVISKLSASRVDDLSRRAGVIAGLDDWQTKFAVMIRAHEQRRSARGRDDVSGGEQAAVRQEIDDLSEVIGLIERLAELADLCLVADTWEARSVGLATALSALVGGEAEMKHWPDEAIEARGQINSALSRLVGLDAIEPNASLATFVGALQAALGTAAPAHGVNGRGVGVMPLADTGALDVAAVFITGLNEGSLPASSAEDSMIDDAQRRLLSEGVLQTRHSRRQAQEVSLAAALAAGCQERVLSMSRSDPRSGRLLMPSRWLIELVGDMTDATLDAGDWPLVVDERISREGLVDVGVSHYLDVADFDLFDAARRWPSQLPQVVDDDSIARRSLQFLEKRSAPFATDVDGIIGPGAISRTDVMSATRLESWARCPMRYYYEYVLEIGEVPRPERVVDLGAADRGTVVHRVLEEFLSPVVAAPFEDRPAPSAPWTENDWVRLETIAQAHFDALEQSGQGGRPLLWRLATEQIRRDLHDWLRADDAVRAAFGSTPEAVEFAIGVGNNPPVELHLPSGRTVSLRGFADRVDRQANGSAVVFDYKTGRAPKPTEFESDITAGGTRLQLGVYALAVDDPSVDADPHAYYWYVSAKGGFARLGYAFDDECRARFVDVVDEIVQGIDEGFFAMNPGSYNAYFNAHDGCRCCPFDRICPIGRAQQVADKQIPVPVSAPSMGVSR